MYAHYTNPSARTNNNATVRISSDIECRQVLHTIEVKGKKAARTVATEYNAKPWNF